MNKFRNAVANILANISLVLFLVIIVILAIPFGLLLTLIGWLSTENGLADSDFTKRLQTIHSNIAKMLKVKE